MVNIALIQLQQYDKLDTPSRNTLILRSFKNVHREAYDLSAKVDFVCLPELWYSKIVRDFEKEFKFILDAAKEYNFVVIPGAFKEKTPNGTYVSCPVIAPNGRILGRQFKVHLFGVQKRTLTPGSKIQVFANRNLKFSVAICYDLVFPEITRSAVLEGADLLFFPSKIPKNGITPWHLYLQVRALENRTAVVAPNVCGGKFGGRSAIVDFNYDKDTDIAKPKIKTGSAVKEQIMIVDIDLKKTRHMRKRRLADSILTY